jgi:hypothetical protein
VPISVEARVFAELSGFYTGRQIELTVRVEQIIAAVDSGVSPARPTDQNARFGVHCRGDWRGAVLIWITEVREMQTVPNSLDARGFKKFKTLQLETVFEGHKNKCLG